MAKAKKKKDGYEWIKAYIDNGELRMEYKLRGSTVVGRMSHDEDVGDFSDAEIKNLVRGLIDASENDEVEIVYG